MATIAEKWLEEGLERGRQEGRQEGLVEGLLAGLRWPWRLGLGARGSGCCRRYTRSRM